MFMCSAASAALIAAGALYGQDVGVGAGGASAQAGPGGASAQAGGASAQAGDQGAAAQAGTGEAAAGASTQQGAGVQAGAGTDAGLQPNPPPAPSLEGQAGADASAQAGASAGADANRPALGVTLSGSGQGDLSINSVQPGSPAAQAGLQAGDQIVSINGEEVSSSQAFIDAVRNADVNGSGEIVILRDGQRQTLNVNYVPWSQVYTSQPYFAMRPNFDAGPGAAPGQPPAYGGAGYGGHSPGYGGYGYGGGNYGGWGCQPSYHTSTYSYSWGGNYGRRGYRHWR
jgi:membrane-associated protease RseP (regulator of RpoE activity)